MDSVSYNVPLSSEGNKQHQISCGDNCNKFHVKLLFDRISTTSSHRDSGFGFFDLGLGVRLVSRTYTHLSKINSLIPYDAIFSNNVVLFARLH